MKAIQLPPLHEKEKVQYYSQSRHDVAVVPYEEAERLILQMQESITRFTGTQKDLELPPNKDGGRFSFEPKLMRLDLNQKTITCFGFYTNDESLWLIQVRYLVNRPKEEPVCFKITSFFNPENPVSIPTLW